MKKLTQKSLKKLFYNDPDVGDLVRKISTCNKVKIGDMAGGYNGDGYLQTKIYDKSYLNHRLIWFYHYGYFPEGDIDHINRNKIDNRLCNLREVSRSCNMRNKGNQKNNKSGVKGVYWGKHANKWVVYIRTNKLKHIGLFKNFSEAVCHRLAAEQCLGWEGCDSCSPAYLYVQKMLKGKTLNRKTIIRRRTKNINSS